MLLREAVISRLNDPLPRLGVLSDQFFDKSLAATLEITPVVLMRQLLRLPGAGKKSVFVLMHVIEEMRCELADQGRDLDGCY